MGKKKAIVGMGLGMGGPDGVTPTMKRISLSRSVSGGFAGMGGGSGSGHSFVPPLPKSTLVLSTRPPSRGATIAMMNPSRKEDASDFASEDEDGSREFGGGMTTEDEEDGVTGKVSSPYRIYRLRCL